MQATNTRHISALSVGLAPPALLVLACRLSVEEETNSDGAGKTDLNADGAACVESVLTFRGDRPTALHIAGR